MRHWKVERAWQTGKEVVAVHLEPCVAVLECRLVAAIDPDFIERGNFYF